MFTGHQDVGNCNSCRFNFNLLKLWSFALGLTKINHMQFLMGWNEDEVLVVLVALDPPLLKMS
jgi:hypothetical protein